MESAASDSSLLSTASPLWNEIDAAANENIYYTIFWYFYFSSFNVFCFLFFSARGGGAIKLSGASTPSSSLSQSLLPPPIGALFLCIASGR